MNKLLTLIICVVFFTACNKKDAEPENYLVAKIGGKTWTANSPVIENSNIGAVIAQDIVSIVGVQEANNANTTVGIFFPKGTKIGEELDFNSNERVIFAYAVSDTEGYLLDVNNGETGKLLVSKLDEENGLVEGSFSGIAVDTRNGNKLEIKDGRFRSKITQGPVTTPKPGKK